MSSPPSLAQLSLSSSPSLPVEIHRYILSFGSLGSLATCCRVSLAFLEIGAELLYRDVDVDTWEGLDDLFCTRSAKSSPVVSQALSLNQIRTFTFELESVKPAYPVDLSFNRFQGVIQVERLTFRRTGKSGISGETLNQLASAFSPLRFEYIYPQAPPRDIWSILTKAVNLREGAVGWHRLSLVRLVNCRPIQAFFERKRATFGSHSWTLSLEISASLLMPGVVWPTTEILPDTKGFLMGNDWWKRVPGEVVSSIEVVVEDEEQKDKVEAFFKTVDPQYDAETVARRMKRISVVVKKVEC